ncbi:MAG: histidine kinase [Solirubrobacteraceae bacterium]
MRRLTPALLATLALAVAATIVVLCAVTEDEPVKRLTLAIIAPVSIAGSALLGWRVSRIAPGNRVADRLVLLAIAVGWLALSDRVLALGLERDTAWVGWAALLADEAFIPPLVALCALIWIFPDGAAPSRAWGQRGRRLGWAILVVVLCAIPVMTVPPEIDRQAVANPFGDAGPVLPWIELLEIPLVGAALLAAPLSIRWRLRRASGIERLQLWWIAYAATLLPLALVVCMIEIFGFGSTSGIAAGAVLLLAPLAIAAAVTVAITRHGLYAVDRLVNRTLVYAALTAALAAVYAAIVLVVGVLLGGSAPPTTAAATLVVAVAFRPLRDRAQREVDRRLARRRHDGMRRVATFLDEVRAGRAEPEAIGAVLRDALGDPGLEVLFRLPASACWARGDGTVEPPSGDDDLRARTPVRRGGVELGVVLHRPELCDRPDTLDGVLSAAGLALEIARLRVEIRVQLAQVAASRAGIVAVQEAERSRTQRELRDGAQQRLHALSVAMRHAQGLIDAHPEEASAALDDAVAEVSAALAQLRGVAQGLRPDGHAGGAPAVRADRRRDLPIVLEQSCVS